MNVLVELEEFVDMCFEDLCGFFDKEIEKSEKGAATINLGDTLQFLAMDVVGEIAFGQTFGGSRFRTIRISQLTIAPAGLTKAGYDTGDFLPMLDAYTASSCLSGTFRGRCLDFAKR